MSGLTIYERLLIGYGAHLPDHPRKWWLHHQLHSLCRRRVDQEFAVVRKGLKWRLNPADYTDSSLYWLNSRNDWDIFHLKNLLNPGVTVLDIGANFGYHSLLIAHALEQKCRIFACEPTPDNFSRLEKHVIDNGASACIQRVAIGVSNREETVRMRRPKENTGHASVDNNGPINNIRLTTLDKLCTDYSIDKVDLLILDVEGYEALALEGAQRILGELKPLILLELFPPVMRRQRATPEAVIEILSQYGYRLFTALKTRLIPLPFPVAKDEGTYVFAFPPNTFYGETLSLTRTPE